MRSPGAALNCASNPAVFSQKSADAIPSAPEDLLERLGQSLGNERLQEVIFGAHY
jgi:hypothetical protein